MQLQELLLSLTLTLRHTLSLTLSLSLTHTLSHTHSLSHTHTRTLSLTHKPLRRRRTRGAAGRPLSISLFLSPSLSHPLFPPLSLSLSLSFTHTKTHTHTPRRRRAARVACRSRRSKPVTGPLGRAQTRDGPTRHLGVP